MSSEKPRRGALLGLSALVLVSATLGAERSQNPVFRASIDVITVDATVLGPDGQPAADLALDDFELRVDGRPRRLASIQFVRYEAAPTPTQTLFARHFTSNEDVNAGRLVVVAVDEAHIRRLEGRPAVRAAAAFVDRLDPLDRVAVAGLSRIDIVEFTRDRAALRRRLESLTGQGDPVFVQFNIGLQEATEIADGAKTRLADAVLRECGRSLTEYISLARAEDADAGRDPCPEQLEQEARAIAQQARTQARISLDALRALIAALRPIDGPKTVVLLSEGMVLEPRLSDLGEIAAAAQEARVAIYALQMEQPVFEASQDRVSPTFLRDIQLRGDGLERLSGATRGAVFRLVGSDPQPFQRIARELSGNYLLGFEAVDGDRNGRLHRVDLRLRRGGHLIRARSAFRLPKAPARTRTLEEDLVGLLRSTRPATELPVGVATYTYAEPGSDRLRIVVSAEADANAGVHLGYVLTDAADVIAASGAQANDSGRHAFSTLVSPGPYTLRVAAIDALRRTGLVERPFVATTSDAGPLRLSSLLLAPRAAGDAPLLPIVDRVSSAQVTAYLEMVDAAGGEVTGARVTFEIETAAGTQVLTFSAAAVRTNGPLAVARADADLSGLAAGRYIARAQVTREGQIVGRVVRPFAYQPR
jgi:VWFA-related protein